MLLSVIIAAYNADRTLPVQLRALAAQTALPPSDWEVVVCDNGSTDATAHVAEEFAAAVPNLRVIDASQRSGPAHARNRGAEVARGAYLAFCDADDEVAVDWLEQLVVALHRHDFIAGSFEQRRLNDEHTLRSRSLDQQDGLQWTREQPFPHAGAGNMAIRRDLFLQVGGFNEHILRLEDTDFCWRVQRKGVPLVFVPEVRVHVRLRSSWRGMFAQGRGYGSAERLLERRYPVSRLPSEVWQLPSGDGTSPIPHPTEPHHHHHRTLPELVWHLGWSSGHRWPQHWAQRRVPQPAPLPDLAYPG